MIINLNIKVVKMIMSNIFCTFTPYVMFLFFCEFERLFFFLLKQTQILKKTYMLLKCKKKNTQKLFTRETIHLWAQRHLDRRHTAKMSIILVS